MLMGVDEDASKHPRYAIAPVVLHRHRVLRLHQRLLLPEFHLIDFV